MYAASQFTREIQNTRELQRILAIPRRIWTEASAEDLAREMTAIMRRPKGSMSLRPIQAQALYDAGTQGGGFFPIRVGGGKTLFSLLAFYVLQSRRPLLVLPAKLIEKTKREQRLLAEHWPIPNFIRIVSYEIMGRAQWAQLLAQYQPDLIVFDEAHKVKNRKAAVTRRIERYLKEHPTTKVVAMTGTITKRSIKDYAHVIKWCINPVHCPVPHSFQELEDWSEALDEKTFEPLNRVEVGALVQLCTPDEMREPDRLMAVRRAYRRRLVETHGIVATTEGFLGSSLTIGALEATVSIDTEKAFETLRTKWTTPDGWEISDPLTMRRHAVELASGFFYRWDPRPPDAWMQARQAWSRACRAILQTNHRDLDSEKQLIPAVEQGHYPDALPLLQAWRNIKASFDPNSVPVWIDDSVIQAAARWTMLGPGIVWCKHVAFAEKLARQTGLAYYGSKGEDAKTGRYIEAHPASDSLIASEDSNFEGRNLQAWNRNLIVTMPPNGLRTEQLLARTHRDGQNADEVTFDVMITCLEHATSFWRARKDAEYIEASTGQSQKILYADIIFPDVDEIAGRLGYRWNK